MNPELEKYCEDNYEIVATTEGLEAPESQTNVETVLQAHPDCQVFVGTGAGPMNGANQHFFSTTAELETFRKMLEYLQLTLQCSS